METEGSAHGQNHMSNGGITADAGPSTSRGAGAGPIPRVPSGAGRGTGGRGLGLGPVGDERSSLLSSSSARSRSGLLNGSSGKKSRASDQGERL